MDLNAGSTAQKPVHTLAPSISWPFFSPSPLTFPSRLLSALRSDTMPGEIYNLGPGVHPLVPLSPRSPPPPPH